MMLIEGVAEALDVDRLGVLVDEASKGAQVVRVGSDAPRDAVVGQHLLDELHRLAVHRGCRNDLIARAGEVEQGRRDGPHARGKAQRRGAAVERGHAPLEYLVGGIAAARVGDGAPLGVAADALAPLEAAKLEGRRLVDGHVLGVVVLGRVVAGVQLACGEAKVGLVVGAVGHRDSPSR